MRHTVAFMLLLLALAADAPAQKAAGRAKATPSPQATPPKPSVSVSFERQAIRENDAVQVHLWVSNEWDYWLSDVTLRADVPRPLKWKNAPCADWDKPEFKDEMGHTPLPIGPLGPHAVKDYAFCIKSGPEIDIGEFNIPFTLKYEWVSGGEPRYSFTTTEKTLKANLFGSDSVAGVPLGLAGLIVPGLFFWVVFSLFKVGWVPWPPGELALGDRLFYSVLVSVFLLFVVSSYNARTLAFPDLKGGIGLPRLLVYIGVGTAAGVVAGLPLRVWQEVNRSLAERREERRRQVLARQVQLDDPPDVLIEKLLNRYPDHLLPKTVVHLKNGTQYEGSLGEMAESATALIGSYSVNVEGLGQPVKDELAAAPLPLDIFEIVRREGLEDRLETYQRITEGGEPDPEGKAYCVWPSEEVLRIDVSREGGEFAPLRLP